MAKGTRGVGVEKYAARAFERTIKESRETPTTARGGPRMSRTHVPDPDKFSSGALSSLLKVFM